MLAGRAAEEVVFDTVTTGASNDIEKATSVARAMITQYGMSEKFGLIGLESIQNRYLDGRPEMYVDIAMSYALIGFVGSVIIAKYLGGKDV